MKVLVTGATGFIGSALVEALMHRENSEPVLALRRPPSNALDHPHAVVGDLTPDTDWSEVLKGCKVLVHCAARAHMLNDDSDDPWQEFYRANVQGSLNLARQAAQAGVKRFVFISSIGVNGNRNTAPFTERHTPQPTEPYARSKWEAEEELRKLSSETGMELVIIRPPLVYGPGAPGNFGLLTKAATSGLPLPLAGIHNRRSFVSLWNLVDFIVRCIDHPEAPGETFVVADGEDVSTTELLRKLAHAADKPSHLFWLPAPLLKAGATALGKRGVYDRLFDSLQVDASHARHTLDWVPPLNLDEGLRRCFCHQDKSHTP